MKKNKNKKLPLVSIILNCYNSAKFLKGIVNYEKTTPTFICFNVLIC